MKEQQSQNSGATVSAPASLLQPGGTASGTGENLQGFGALTADAWHRHRASVYRYLRRRLPEREQAEDLTQETFLRLCRATPPLLEPAQVRAWLFHTARNLIADHYRARRNEVSLDEVSVPLETDAASSLLALEPCIAPLAARLPASYGAALLWDLEGVPQAEIARRQSLSLSGAKSQVQRARGLLRQEFERCCQYHFGPDGALVAYTPRKAGNCG